MRSYERTRKFSAKHGRYIVRRCRVLLSRFIPDTFAIFPCLAKRKNEDRKKKASLTSLLRKLVNASARRQCNFAQKRTESHARLISYPAVIGAAQRPDALYRRDVIYCRHNAIGRVKISLSNWTACRRPHGDTTPGRLFRPFYATFFLVAVVRFAKGE